MTQIIVADTTGKWACDSCRERANKGRVGRMTKFAEAGVCYYCGEPGEGVCTACRKKARDRQAKWREDRRAQGLCTRCDNPARPGSLLCEEHRKKITAQERSSGVPLHACKVCGHMAFHPRYCSEHIAEGKARELAARGGRPSDGSTCPICGLWGHASNHCLQNGVPPLEPREVLLLGYGQDVCCYCGEDHDELRCPSKRKVTFRRIAAGHFYILRPGRNDWPRRTFLDFSSTRDPYRVLRARRGAIVEVVADGLIRTDTYPNELFHARLKNGHLWGRINSHEQRAARIARAYCEGAVPAYTFVEGAEPVLDIGDPVAVVAGAYSKLRGSVLSITESHYTVRVEISSRTAHQVDLPFEAVVFAPHPPPKKGLRDYWALVEALRRMPEIDSVESPDPKSQESTVQVEQKPEPVVVPPMTTTKNTKHTEATAALTVALPESLVRKFRVLCAARDESMSATLTNLVNDFVRLHLEAELKTLVESGDK